MTAQRQSQKINLTDISQLNFDKLYTYEEYFTWQFPERIELIDGVPYHLFPAPNMLHQTIVVSLTVLWGSFLKDKKCKIFVAPFDVYFPNGKSDKINTVVQPDLCIICDSAKIEKKGINGAPDLIIEILSSNQKRDLTDKYSLYEREGVQEYWIVHPDEKWLVIYTLNDNAKYIGSKHFTPEDGSINSVSFPDFKVDLAKLFDFAID